MNSYNGFTPNQRMKAYKWLMEQYATGKRFKPTKCDSCGITKGIIEPHSENYGEPFGNHIGYYGFCYRCHMILHCRFRNPEAFARYADEVYAGTVFTPFYTRDFGTFSAQHLKNWCPPVDRVTLHSTNVLWEIHHAVSTH
jgi:hypothetical protein